MKKFLLFAFLAASAFAQNSPIPTQTWSVNYSEIALPGGKQTFAGSEAGIGFQPTTNLKIFEENILAPQSATFGGYFGGGASYDLPALSVKLNNASTQVSGFRFKFSLVGSLGVDRNTFGSVTKQNWAGTARVRVAYSIDSGNTWQTGVEVGAARFPNFAQGVTPLAMIGFAKLW